MMESKKEYFAFISYKREDEKWAKWLAHELEYYHLPIALNGRNLPKNLRPIFRDIDELNAGNLPAQIYQALSVSKNLIVICSPRSAKSEWVNKEIDDFIKIKDGKVNNIFPFIIEGIPFSGDDNECFPEKLRSIPKNEERYGGNVNETGGKYVAVVKTIAGMLGVDHDSLWNRYEKEQKKRRRIKRGLLLSFMIFVLAVVISITYQNILLKETDMRMKVNLSRAVAERAYSLIDEGDSYLASMLALEILPCDSYPNRPYTSEAERLLRTSLQKETAIMKTDEYGNVGFCSDGSRFIFGSYIWDMKSGSKILNIKSSKNEIIHKWHPSGDYFVSTIDDTIKLCNSFCGNCVNTYLGHKKDVLFVTFDPTGDIMISGGKDNTIQVWETSSGRCLKTIDYSLDGIIYWGFSRSGDKFVLVTDDSSISIFNTKSFEIVKRITLNVCPSSGCVDLSPDGNVIVFSKLYSLNMFLWNIEKNKIEGTINTNTNVHTIKYSIDGKSIIIGGQSGVDVYDLQKHTFYNICQTSSSVQSLSVSSEGRHALIKTLFDNNLYLIDFKPNLGEYLLSDVDSSSFHGFFSTSNGKYVGATNSEGVLYLWNSCSGKICKRYNLKKSIFGDYIHYAHIHPNRNAVVYLAYNNIGKILNLKSGKNELILEGKIDDSMFLKFSDNGDYIVGSKYRWEGVKIWDAKTGRLKCDYINNNDTVYTDVLVPHKNLLISIFNSSVLCFKDISNNCIVRKIKGLSNKVTKIKCSRNGKYLASLSSDSTICIWDLSTGELMHRYNNVESSRDLLVLCNDESKVAYQGIDNSVYVWDIITGKLINRFSGHINDIIRVDGICFSPDGKYMLTSSKDKSIRLWDVVSGGCIRVFKGNWRLNSAFFNKDGSIIYQREKQWLVDRYLVYPLDYLIEETRKRFANRTLTDEEKMRFYLK